MDKELIQQWIYYLDKEKENYILIKITSTPDMQQLIEYVVIYISLINEKPVEIIKFDGSKKETSHTHKYYSLKKEKTFQNKPINFETIEKITDYLERKWVVLKTQYLENKQ